MKDEGGENMDKNITDRQVIDWLNHFYLDKNFDAIRDLYSNGSYNEILAVGRKELSHSAFLAWLLDAKGSHGLGNFSLLQLLKIIIRRDLQQNVGTGLRQYMSEVYNEDVSFQDMTINRETSLRAGRTDIEINVNASFGSIQKSLHVVIENKVQSKEGKNQTEKYFQNYKKKGNEVYVFVYLTPKHKEQLDAQTEPSCSCKSFVEINYQDILDDILEPSLEKVISERAKFMIKEYIRCLGMPIADVENKNRKKTIMATSKEVSEMLSAFWDKNEDLLIAVMETIASDMNQDPTVREKARELSNATISAGKDKTHYRFGDKINKGKNAIIMAVLGYLMSDGRGVGYEDINSEWEDFIQSQKGEKNEFKEEDEWTIGRHPEFENKELKREHTILQSKSIPFVYSKEEYNKEKAKKRENSVLEHDFSMIKCGDNQYFYYNQWGWKNIDYFLKFYRERMKRSEDPDIELV